MASNQFCVKSATITVGSTQVEGKIVSPVTVSGGDLAKTTLNALDGTAFTCLGIQNPFELAFDMIVDSDDAAILVYGSGSTIGKMNSVVFQQDGSQTHLITIDMGTNTAGDGLKYLFSGSQMMNGIPKFESGSANILSISATCEPQNFSRQYTLA